MDFVVGMRCGLATPKNLENQSFRESFNSDHRICSNMEGLYIHQLRVSKSSVTPIGRNNGQSSCPGSNC